MPALLAAILFSLFAGAVASPATPPPGEEFIPGKKVGGAINCIPADASTSKPAVLFNIPKPDRQNVPFVDEPSNFCNCQGEGACDVNPWDGTTYPATGNYVEVTTDVVVTNIWPHEETTRLVPQILPADPQHDPYREQVYRATCNDWCCLVPPYRDPALPYGGTFFCDFIFFYRGLNQAGRPMAYVTKQGLKIPDDSQCNKETYEGCPLFDILIREGAPVPEVAGGAGPDNSRPEPLRCDVSMSTTVSQNSGKKRDNRELLASSWIEAIQNTRIPPADAQTETFIYVAGEEWILAGEQSALAKDLNTPELGREQIPGTINFRGNTYEMYYNLVKTVTLRRDHLFLTEEGVVDFAESERAAGRGYNTRFNYLEFRKSVDIHPGGKTLQLGTFPVVTAKGYWEMFTKESKPAIYLYPPERVDLNVTLDTKGEIIVSDPHYNPDTGWNITAYPDGTLQTIVNGQMLNVDYPYLFYEAVLDKVYVEETGDVVAGPNLRAYFEEKLPSLGLSEREIADFSEYWLSRLDKSQPYYLVHYLSEEQIEDLEPAILTDLTDGSEIIPDTSIRIRAYFKPLDKPIDAPPQKLIAPPARTGFTLVEWGGFIAAE